MERLSGKERLRLVIAYDGRPFRGWQSQVTKDAVQDFLETAFEKLTGERVGVSGAGRTDAGVHALGQVAHVDVPRARMPVGAWQKALNAHLPREVRIVRLSRAKPNFHARFDATGKIYTYRLWLGTWLHPLEIGRAWHVPGSMDFETLRAAADILTGTHDFAAFAANRGNADPDTVRTIWSIAIHRRAQLVILRFQGDGFLYKMIRLLTGTMVHCAQGRSDLARIEAFLTSPRAEKTKQLAPAHGLYLTRVLYGRAPVTG